MSISKFEFGRVDAAAEAAPFVDYLDHMTSWDAVAAGKRSRTALLTGDGRRALLDVGCGVGEDVRAMAALLGPGGRVVGVDPSASLVAEARARTTETACDVMFEVAEGAAMPFADGAFDAARLERVLQHTTDPDAVLAETRRVVRPGGLVVATEPDWTSLALDADPEAVQALVAVYEQLIRRPRIGRELRRRFVDAGLTAVAVHVEPLVVTDVDTLIAVGALDDAAAPLAAALGDAGARAFRDELAQRSRTGRLFATCALVVAVGSVPE